MVFRITAKSKNIFKDNQDSDLRTPKNISEDVLETDENSQFNESMNYLTSLTKQNEMKERMEKTKNQTLKRHETINQFENTLYNQPKMNPIENVHLNFPSDINTKIHPDAHTSVVPFQWKHHPPPTHGCLKNGNLPTYRTWKNQTQVEPRRGSGSFFE